MPDRADRDWAAAAAPELLAEARREALAEVRLRLRERLVAALMAAVEDLPGAPAPAAPGPARPPAPRPARAPEVPTAAQRPVEDTAVWAYGVLAADAAEPEGWPGVDDGRPVRTVRHAGLCALVSDVPLPEFGTESLHEQLEDLTRLEALARGHETVLDRALELGAVVPFRLCTIYASDASLAEMLERERGPLRESLERLRGAREWGVKGFLAGGEARADEAEPAEASTGTEYLTRKRRAREAVEQARETVWEAVERIHAGLSEQAEAAVLARPHDRRLSGRDADMVLNGSYLVPDARLEHFRSAVAELGERFRDAGIELELTGPWPAYHFVEWAGDS
jgi:Gas vesicle synthesis protein GvpL/GvpF